MLQPPFNQDEHWSHPELGITSKNVVHNILNGEKNCHVVYSLSWCCLDYIAFCHYGYCLSHSWWNCSFYGVTARNSINSSQTLTRYNKTENGRKQCCHYSRLPQDIVSNVFIYMRSKFPEINTNLFENETATGISRSSVCIDEVMSL
jgi:hypothetical protein